MNSESTNENERGTDRRTFLKGVGVTSAAAMTGGVASGTAAAESTTTSTSDSDGDWLDGFGFGGDNATASAKALGYTAIGPIAKEAGEFLYGQYQQEISERTAQQMELDHYAYVQQIKRTLQALIKENYNSIQLGQHKAVADAKWAVYEAMQNDAGVSTSGLKARQATFDAGAVFEKNFLVALEEAYAKLHSIRDLQVTHEGISDPHIWFYTDTDGDLNEDLHSLSDVDVTLMNGETFSTKAISTGAQHDSALKGYYVHPYFHGVSLSDGSDLSDHITDPRPDTNTGEYSLRYQHQYQWDNNGGHILGFEYDAYDSNNPAIQPFAVVENLDGIGDVLIGESQHLSMYVASILRERYITLANEMQTMGENAYEAYENGEIEPDDIIDPYMAAQNSAQSWRDTGHHGYAAFMAAMEGYSSDLSKTFKISYYDASDQTTSTLTGNLLADPDTMTASKTQTKTIDSWTFSDRLALSHDSEYFDHRTGYTVRHVDSSGTSTTLSEGDDYSISWQSGNENVVINSDGSNIGSVTEGSGSIEVDVTAKVSTSVTWKTGKTYSVSRDGQYVFAKSKDDGGGILSMDKGDEFTIEKMWNSDNQEITNVTAGTYNVQTRSTAGLYEQLRQILKAQQDLNQTNATVGGGSGSSNGFNLSQDQLLGLAAGVSGLGVLAYLFNGGNN
ncbi:twin-arginine translocation signal domain-containing protein [Natronoarchaeum mannanilyticum]|uniref:Envelope protein N-terminal domain-containing protein n=1 Tax=Natronoarchaeum mannanilyticum TaxID=926360 RepID=A0AAV3TD25_9EURY